MSKELYLVELILNDIGTNDSDSVPWTLNDVEKVCKYTKQLHVDKLKLEDKVKELNDVITSAYDLNSVKLKYTSEIVTYEYTRTIDSYIHELMMLEQGYVVAEKWTYNNKYLIRYDKSKSGENNLLKEDDLDELFE